MKEVSCRFFDILLRDLAERGIDPQRLVAGTPYDPAHLANKDERVEWTALLRMLENGRALWTREQLLRLGERSTEGSVVQFIGVVARIRFSLAGFYEWVTAPDGVASHMITSMKTTARLEGPGRVTVDFHLLPGYETSEEFFLITQGTYAQMPRMMGAAPAQVTCELTPYGARFHIRFTEPRGAIARVRKVVTAPFTMRQAAKELTDAHGSLLARYDELDAARAKIERQAGLLDVAYQLGQRISTSRDLYAIGRSVLDTLRARQGVVGVRLAMQAYEDVVLEDGTRDGPPTATARLTGKPGIELDVWTAEGDDGQALLDLILPTIRLAIDNATAYRDLAEYQVGLEKLVDVRTRELRQAQEAREIFFGNISHEIRTPLSLIMLAVADIRRRAGKDVDAASHASLGAISDASKKLLRLVDELLLLAAGQADKLVLAPEPTNVTALVEQLVAAWRLAADAAGHTLEASIEAGVHANVDPVAFERVASNLLSNAVKYTPRGGTVRVELARGDELRLSIFDTGPGIDAAFAERLFDRFARSAGEERRQAGTGIGLALVKQLVEAHDGSVVAVPRASGGTEFRVTLPATRVTQRATAATATLRTDHAPVAVSELRSGTVFAPAGVVLGTIVVAEDEPRLAESIARLLSEQYRVIVALDGVDALEQVKIHTPQLLITDVEMPRMNGIELATAFREATGDRLAPVIILSAVNDLKTRVAGLEAGAVDYVTKPFDPDELRARVQAQFRMRELAMRLHRAEQLSSMGILTAGLAHELRNPANGIVNAIAPLTALLPPELTGPETDAGQLLDAMRASADQIAFLVRQLLGFRQSGKGTLELRPVEVAPLVQRAVSLARDALAGVEVRTSVNVDRRAMCSAPLVVQVLANLVENAGHAAGRGGWVSIRGTSTDGRVIIEITDSGPGVPVEMRERIFEPFYTTKAPGKGTGLGLSVARAIAHRHDGTLELREIEGRTAFVFDLPAESKLGTTANTV